MTAPSPEYLTRRLTQISAALSQRDGAVAVAIINLIVADGYPEAAATIARELVERGLNNMVAAQGGAS